MSAQNRASPLLPLEWTLALVLAADLAWTVLSLGGYRAETMVITWLLTGVAAIVYLGRVVWLGEKPHAAGWWLVPFLVYGAVNAGWVTPVPWLGWRDWYGWLHLVVVFWIVLNGIKEIPPRRFLFGTAVGLGVVAVVLACYQRFVWPDWLMMGRRQSPQFLERASGPFGIPNSLAAYMIVLAPALMALAWQRGAGLIQRIFCGYLAVLFLFALALTISRGAWISLALAMAAWPLLGGRRSWESRMMTSLAAFAGAGILGAAAYFYFPQVERRFDILVRDAGERSRPTLWDASWSLFEESPLLGTGAGSYDVLFERHRPEQFNDDPQWTHNEYLNTLSDYGLVGFALLLGGVAVVAVQARQRGGSAFPEATIGWAAPEVAAALATGLLAFAFSAFVDFHFKIPALGMLVAMVAAEVVRRNWPQYEASGGVVYQIGSAAGALMFFVVALGGILPSYRGEAARVEGREAIDLLAAEPDPSVNRQKEILTAADYATADALSDDDGNAQSWGDRAYVLSLWGRLAPLRMNDLGSQAEAAAREALKRTKVVPEYWIRLGVALDMQGRWADGSEAFLEALNLAPHNAAVWYYYAYHLGLETSTRRLALAAIDTSLRLDGGNRSAILLRESLKNAH